MQNIVVTGFDLFGGHQSNPSWEAIKDGLKIDRPGINLIAQLVVVSYRAVDQLVPILWDKFRPILMVHVGLAAHENTIRIEQIARHGPYLRKDVDGHAPHEDMRQSREERDKDDQQSVVEGPNRFEFGCSRSCLNIERVCEKLNRIKCETNLPIEFTCSQDAGLYVCEYIYQKSLQVCDRTVFVHVPNTEKFSIEDIRLSLQHAIEALIDELNEVQ